MAIDMTCADISAEDLLRCSFGLSGREVAVLLTMLDDGGWMTVSAIAGRSRRDRSVAQRALASLLSKGVAERDQRNRAGGGYEYVYRARGRRAIRRAILMKSRAFCAMVAERVREW